MMHGVIALRLVVPFEEWEVDHPEGSEDALVAETELVAHLEAQVAELLAHLHRLSRHDEKQVARFGAHAFAPAAERGLVVEFIHAALDRAVFLKFNPYESFGAGLRTTHEFREGVELLAGVGCGAGHADADSKFGLVGHRETVALGQVGELHELHAEADIGLVAAVAGHGVGPCDAREGFGEIDVLHIFEDMFH